MSLKIFHIYVFYYLFRYLYRLFVYIKCHFMIKKQKSSSCTGFCLRFCSQFFDFVPKFFDFVLIFDFVRFCSKFSDFVPKFFDFVPNFPMDPWMAAYLFRNKNQNKKDGSFLYLKNLLRFRHKWRKLNLNMTLNIFVFYSINIL